MRKYGSLLLIVLSLAAIPCRAAEPEISADKLNMLDRLGYFTPAFKQAVHDLVAAKQAVVDAKAEEEKLKAELPDLEKQVAEANGRVEGLQKQFSDLDRLDETDFTELQAKMNDASAPLQDKVKLAQAYVWAYPTSPHQADAQKYLQDTQKAIADKAQADADDAAAKAAAHAKLVARAQARDLSVVEWRDFLLNMSKEDLLKFLGTPQEYNQDNWVYKGAWTTDAATNQKVGLEINFNAGRVINVTEAPGN
jgi:hypothetical protein